MNRQEIKTLLHGVENAGDIIDRIKEINGADFSNPFKAPKKERGKTRSFFGAGDRT